MRSGCSSKYELNKTKFGMRLYQTIHSQNGKTSACLNLQVSSTMDQFDQMFDPLGAHSHCHVLLYLYIEYLLCVQLHCHCQSTLAIRGMRTAFTVSSNCYLTDCNNSRKSLVEVHTTLSVDLMKANGYMEQQQCAQSAEKDLYSSVSLPVPGDLGITCVS
jgi:hypothetical protein